MNAAETLRPSALPAAAGVGFKPRHFAAILADRLPAGFFFEVHAENYMGAGGPPHAQLTRLRADFPLSVHGVGLSIGGAGPLDAGHLARLKQLCDRYQPESVSEHLAWSSHGGVYLDDLLPLPYTPATLDRVASHVAEMQDGLGRQMLLENPATYLRFAESTIPEPAFLAEVARRTGCGLLLDLDNVVVSAANHGEPAAAYLAAFPLAGVRQIHLAGHADLTAGEGAPLLIDSHEAAVPAPVWQLFEAVIGRAGRLPTLVEWDNGVPGWPALRAEAAAAQARLDALAPAAAA